MLDFEKLGSFYLGRRHDEETDKLTDELVLYDARDLTTHAVIIGMTGSGKTGLGIGILEEAALDHVPVIAIDPKGDMGNLLLTFPKLSPEAFLPWVNPRAASDSGQSVEEFAASQASLWKKGLGDWGQTEKRIADLRSNVDMAIYTPGSNAGLPVSVLRSFAAPDASLMHDIDLYRERIQATATGILTLLGIDADPVASREHILISRILDNAWQEGRSLDVAGLITAIQAPPFAQVGIMSLDAFFPEKDRFALAMRLNNLLAAPGFEAWMQGEPLSAGKLFYTADGKPRISIMSIAHLDDASRMFFVCMLLNEIIAWMRAQQGTPSLRAILYMDEILGYLPPVANPPSKALFLTLLKQARAYGLGLVLATQNPVDLDYKGLSNTGTWFIGRLQTERDKARVMEGLEGTSNADFDRQAMERTLAGLGKRRFLLHNVHEDEPVVFGTRWVMSYLAGPLTREQIRSLMGTARDALIASVPGPARTAGSNTADAPALPPSIEQYFVPGGAAELTYYPRLIVAADLLYSNARYGVDTERSVIFTVEIEDAPVAVDWDSAEALPVGPDELRMDAEGGALYAGLPAAATQPKNYPAWGREFRRWVRQNETVTIFRSRRFRLTSGTGETEGEFRVRLQTVANEQRDLAVAKLRKRYATKTTTLENRLMRANQAISREQQQATKKNLDTAVSIGTAILGTLLGRKRVSASSARRVGTAIKTAGGARKEAADVARARETAARVAADLAALNRELGEEIAALDTAFDAQSEALDEIVVRAKASDLHVSLNGLAWMPYVPDSKGRLRPAWQ